MKEDETERDNYVNKLQRKKEERHKRTGNKNEPSKGGKNIKWAT
jgi:hypothetical protein